VPCETGANPITYTFEVRPTTHTTRYILYMYSICDNYIHHIYTYIGVNPITYTFEVRPNDPHTLHSGDIYSLYIIRKMQSHVFPSSNVLEALWWLHKAPVPCRCMVLCG
jgi:hypothetical protein